MDVLQYISTYLAILKSFYYILIELSNHVKVIIKLFSTKKCQYQVLDLRLSQKIVTKKSSYQAHKTRWGRYTKSRSKTAALNHPLLFFPLSFSLFFAVLFHVITFLELKSIVLELKLVFFHTFLFLCIFTCS